MYFSSFHRPGIKNVPAIPVLSPAKLRLFPDPHVKWASKKIKQKKGCEHRIHTLDNEVNTNQSFSIFTHFR